MPACRAPQIVLDNPQGRVRAIFVRTPSIRGHLASLAAKFGEKCGLTANRAGDQTLKFSLWKLRHQRRYRRFALAKADQVVAPMLSMVE